MSAFASAIQIYGFSTPPEIHFVRLPHLGMFHDGLASIRMEPSLSIPKSVIHLTGASRQFGVYFDVPHTAAPSLATLCRQAVADAWKCFQSDIKQADSVSGKPPQEITVELRDGSQDAPGLWVSKITDVQVVAIGESCRLQVMAEAATFTAILSPSLLTSAVLDVAAFIHPKLNINDN